MTPRWPRWLVVVCALCAVVSVCDGRKRRCESLTMPICQDLAYNETVFPNLLDHQRQDDAALEAHQFHPLVAVKCSPVLQFFLCTVYAPVCTALDRPVPPCRGLCLAAKQGCEAIMSKFGVPWPGNLDCEKFPEKNTPETLCVGIEVETFEERPGNGPYDRGQSPVVVNQAKTIQDLHRDVEVTRHQVTSPGNGTETEKKPWRTRLSEYWSNLKEKVKSLVKKL